MSEVREHGDIVSKSSEEGAWNTSDGQVLWNGNLRDKSFQAEEEQSDSTLSADWFAEALAAINRSFWARLSQYAGIFPLNGMETLKNYRLTCFKVIQVDSRYCDGQGRRSDIAAWERCQSITKQHTVKLLCCGCLFLQQHDADANSHLRIDTWPAGLLFKHSGAVRLSNFSTCFGTVTRSIQNLTENNKPNPERSDVWRSVEVVVTNPKNIWYQIKR